MKFCSCFQLNFFLHIIFKINNRFHFCVFLALGTGWRICMDNSNSRLHSVIILLRLCYHANSIRNVGQTIRCNGIPWMGHVYQFDIRIFSTSCCTIRWRLLAVRDTFHSRFRRRSDCAMHTCYAGQMDSTKRKITNGSCRLCW